MRYYILLKLRDYRLLIIRKIRYSLLILSIWISKGIMLIDRYLEKIK